MIDILICGQDGGSLIQQDSGHLKCETCGCLSYPQEVNTVREGEEIREIEPFVTAKPIF